MNKKVLVSILAISSIGLAYTLFKKFHSKKINQIIPASSVYRAIWDTQNSYKESVESL